MEKEVYIKRLEYGFVRVEVDPGISDEDLLIAAEEAMWDGNAYWGDVDNSFSLTPHTD